MKSPDDRIPKRGFPVLLCTEDADGRLIDVNSGWHATLGYATEDLIGRKLCDLMPRPKREISTPDLDAAGSAEGFNGTFHCTLLATDGTEHEYWHSAVPQYDDSENQIGSFGVFCELSPSASANSQPATTTDHKVGRRIIDPHERQDRVEEPERSLLAAMEDSKGARVAKEEAHRKISESDGRYRAMVATVADGIVLLDETGKIHMFNPAAESIFGYSLMECIGRNSGFLFGEKADGGSNNSLQKYLRHTGDKIARYAREVTGVRKDGSIFPIELTVSPIDSSDGTMLLAVCRDITERKRTEHQLELLAKYDPLTGLANRTLFHEMLENALEAARRIDRNVGILFLDLDRFKDVNDTLGHPAGDELLKSVAQRLLSCVRTTDTVARLGGDEFAIIATLLDDSLNINRLAARIISTLNEPILLDGHKVHTGTSIGITIFPDDASEAEKLLKAADLALYQAKDSGRNNFKCYQSRMDEKVHARIRLENDLRNALENEKFELFYQPQLDLRSGRISGVEALIRWHDEARGLIPPDQFLPVAESSGLILQMTEWILRTACRQVKELRNTGQFEGRVAVNLSPPDMKRPDLTELVSRTLKETGVSAEFLELEITEGMIMGSIETAVQTIEELHALGVGISVDDFGTGYSSLAYLKKFPVDKLKIDRSFISDLSENPDDLIISQAIINLGHNLNLRVIAEGVETEDHLLHLQRLGCDEIQGYFLCRPLPMDEVAEFLKSNGDSEAEEMNSSGKPVDERNYPDRKTGTRP